MYIVLLLYVASCKYQRFSYSQYRTRIISSYHGEAAPNLVADNEC